jgi:hypothetical protein
MPERKTKERARRAKRAGKSASTQAGEFVREEIHHIREGKHGARSTKQAIAIGLSKARRAGVPLKPPKKGSASAKTRRKAQRDAASGAKAKSRPSPKRAKATESALKREGHGAASHGALAKHARTVAKHRTAAQRSSAAKKAARTKGAAARSQAARKAARTRAQRRAQAAPSSS